MIPPASPTRVKRRFTPLKPASAERIVSSSISISTPTAMAASAFWTLCAPSIGRRKGFMVRARPVARSCTVTSKVAPMRSVSSFSARTSAWGEKP